MDKMVDKACDDQTIERMRNVVLSRDGVKEIDNMKTRMFGAKVYVDIEIAADENITLIEAHKIAENVHGAIEKEFTEVKHCMVHVNPYGAG